MRLKLEGQIQFKEVMNRTSKKTGEIFQLIVLADLVNVEKFEFFKRDEINLNGYSNGDMVNCEFEISRRGYNTNVDLVSMSKAVK